MKRTSGFLTISHTRILHFRYFLQNKLDQWNFVINYHMIFGVYHTVRKPHYFKGWFFFKCIRFFDLKYM